MAKNKLKVLFFLEDAVATEAEEEAASKYSANRHVVCFRNSRYIHDGDAIEPFDIVAGAIPPQYAEAAKDKPAIAERKPPKSDASKVTKGSPTAPDDADKDKKEPPADDTAKQPEGAGTDAGQGAGNTGAGEGAPAAPAAQEPPKEPEAGDKAKPVAPEPKPNAAKGWKPNA